MGSDSSVLVRRLQRADAVLRTARVTGEMLAAVVPCSGWISLDVASHEPLAERGVVRAELRQAASRELRRMKICDAPRRLRSGGVYGDILAVRVRAQSDICMLVLLARFATEPKFDARDLSVARATAEEIVARFSSRDDARPAALSSIRRRGRASVLIVNRNLDVISMSLADDCLTVLDDATVTNRLPRRLSPHIEAAVRELVATWPADFTGGADEIIVSLGDAVLRMVPMHSESGDSIGVLLERARTTTQIQAAAATKYSITNRELEVVRLLIKGLSAEEISNELGIAETTVAAHVRSVMAKTQSRNRTEAIAKLLAP